MQEQITKNSPTLNRDAVYTKTVSTLQVLEYFLSKWNKVRKPFADNKTVMTHKLIIF